ncbi:N-acetylmuramoyl-L-alanine amidase [Marinomonas sp. S3726]|uniref:N-acetylmuramoyl-L-alanine amidase n=1 Tax=Marinomonas sp. S3726 TaxID=579484 RepID=UPI0005F9B3E4|nr:N-acetylmuramoyl-L-alanine amidase [Marinomonas sp. S3726]
MGNKRQLSQIDSIIIHCADTPNGRPNTIEDVDEWHRKRNPPFTRNMGIAPEHQPHLKHVGYHFVIGINGDVQEGRPLIETGAHAGSYNAHSVGICMFGKDKFTHAQWESLFKLVQRIESTVGSVLTLYGHNQLSPKTCPGFDVPTWIKRKFRPLDKHLLDRGFYELDY